MWSRLCTPHLNFILRSIRCRRPHGFSHAASKDAEEKQESDGASNHHVTTISATGPRAPPQLRNVSLCAPANLSPLEVEVIKLTAQYVALSESKGSGALPRSDNFLSNLTLKEWSNPEFAFLQPRHSHFAYFTALVDGYRSFLPGGEEYEQAQNKVMEVRMDAKRERLANLIVDDDDAVDSKSKDEKSSIKKKKKDVVQSCLETAAYRAEYQREVAERRREEAAEGPDGLYGAGAIDWHDFVVVETIGFAEDEVVEALPPPTALRLAALNKEQPVNKEEKVEESSSEESDADMDDASDDDDDDGEKLKVVTNYQPKVVSTHQITTTSSRTHIIDPITGKSIAISDMPEHMRIQLLDPKWAEERKRFLDKQRETNFVAGDDIASNISKFAQARGDIFGSSEKDLVEGERRLEEANRLIREQAMMQPGPQLQQMQPRVGAMTGVINTGAMPPPRPPMAPPPTFVPPPPPPQRMAQPNIQSEEPAAKRPKLDDSLAPPPPPPPGMPMAPPGAPPPPPTAAATTEGEPLSESDFIATLATPDDIPICIRIPHDPTNSHWNFNGQTLDITVKATSKIKELKNMPKEELGGMPMNKMQIKHPNSGFMNKDGLSMAYFNVGPMTTLDLVPKTRGGRK